MGLLEGNIGKILEGAFVGIILCDGQYNCIEVSDVAVRILGVPATEIIGKNIEEVFRIAGLGIVLNDLRLITNLKDHESRIYTLKLTPSPHIVKIKIFPYNDENSKQELIGVILCEIWQEEAHFDDSINREFIFKKLFYNSPFPMWIYEPTTLKFIIVNDAAVRTFGYTTAEFLSMRVDDIKATDCDDGEKFEQIFQTKFKAETEIWKCKKKNGEPIYVEITESSIVFGKQNAVVALARNVTEEFKALAELNYTNELLTLVWEHSPEGLRLTDENGIIIKVNDAFCKLVGKSREELEGKKFTSIYHNSIAERIEHIFLQRFRKREFPSRFEDKFKLWDGREVWLEVYNSFFEIKGQIPMLLSIFRNVTESKQTFEKIKLIENRYKMLSEHVSDVVCVTDRQMNIIDISHSVKKFLNFSPAELIDKSLLSLLSLKSLNVFQFEFARCINNPLLKTSTISVELEFINKDGRSIWADVCIDPLFDNEENHVGYVWAIRDISDRMRAQAILRLQAAALESAASGIIITTIDGTIVWANSAFSQLTGYDVEEIIGKKPSILKSNRQTREFYQRLWETILSGRNWHGELVNKRKDGSLYVEEMTITPVFGQGMEITHFVAIKSDITKRKEMERELRHSQKRFELIFNSNPAGMAIATLRDFRLIDVNNSFLELTRLSKSDIIGSVFDELEIFEKQQEWEELKKKLALSDSIDNFEITIRSKEKKIHNILVSTEKITIGLEECAIFIFNDITERKLAEEQLRHSNKLETLGALAGAVAHDFNNMLTVIEGHVSMSLVNPSLPAEVQKSLNEIHEAAERAANLTRQILAFGRKRKFEPGQININQLISDLVKILRRLVGENVKIETVLQPNIPAIIGDIGMIEQIMMNLVVNARDAMPKGGLLTIATASQYIPVNKLPNRKGVKDGDYVIISVKDTGTGIAPENLSKIFDPFFTTKPVGKGTGLGLAIVQDNVYKHNGWIDVRSKLGAGTEFIVYLPSAENIARAQQQTQFTQTVKGGAETIMIVEDDDKVRELARAALEQYGYVVVTARSASEAMTYWKERKNQFSLIILDMVLPGGCSGIRLAEELSCLTPNLKVILMGAYLSNGLQPEMYNLRGWHYIQKPFLPSTLAKIVRQVLDTNSNLINQ